MLTVSMLNVFMLYLAGCDTRSVCVKWKCLLLSMTDSIFVVAEEMRFLHRSVPGQGAFFSKNEIKFFSSSYPL